IREDPPKWSTFLHPDPEKSKGRTTADYYEKKAGRVSATMVCLLHIVCTRVCSLYSCVSPYICSVPLQKPLLSALLQQM
ncbi:hypothetical protein SARC_16973, partial [Sphaeroforma arctica JP610]